LGQRRHPAGTRNRASNHGADRGLRCARHTAGGGTLMARGPGTIQSIGLGWDLHRLEAGRPLILCNVTIPFEKGLAGHSDADVALHAVSDALLGAAALGDIGEKFPPSDARWAGADSGQLLRMVMQDVTRAGWVLVNVDVTIVAERPKLTPHKPPMRQRLAELLALPVERVSIKAKTFEGVDAVGQGLAMSAYAIVGLGREQPMTAG
jgi:2-C-methyl-D-erythritol 2,4-cyclodiphosphate synthase